MTPENHIGFGIAVYSPVWATKNYTVTLFDII
jgi:hypothetical protein